MTNLETWGISEGFHDVYGGWHPAPPGTVADVVRAMGAGPGVEPPPPSVVTVRLDHPLPPLPPGVLVLEDGGEVRTDGVLPADLPPGYHQMRPESGEAFQLITSSGVVPVPERPMWGFSAQLYATRSERSWGMGDLADLRRLGEWSAGLGAEAALINPLHACAPGFPQQASPYYAGSRCFSNPIYIAVEEVAGASAVGDVDRLARAGRALNSDRRVDRDQVWALKSEALEAVFDRFDTDPSFEAYKAERGEPLARFAAYCALAEVHGPDWPSWPAEYGRPSAGGVGRYLRSVGGRRRAEYHSWLQWVLDGQMGRAAAPVGLVQDLAVGVDPGGADAWIWQDCFADGMRVGAPPDEFNTQGQDWGLHPFDPWRLRRHAYQPWIEGLRSGLRHGRGLRVDHVMGLFRLFWIPERRTPVEGVYVRYPHHDLLNILALEAHRSSAFVVGEDLGTVEDEVRRDLAERRVLSYRVWWFEERPSPEWPPMAMGAVTTHDLPTIAGVVAGSDLEAQRQLGLNPNEEASEQLRRMALERTGSDEATPVSEVISRVYDDLGRAPCLVLTASLDDCLAVEERPNMPGTIDQWPNWCLALPVPLERFADETLFGSIADGLRRSS